MYIRKSKDMENQSLNKLRKNEQKVLSKYFLKTSPSQNAINNSICKLKENYKQVGNNKSVDAESKEKSSKIASVLDSYFKTDILDESSDFIQCDSRNKFKSSSQKPEVLLCEICKEDITSLDIHNRGVHVNNCIDKQISSASVPAPDPEIQVSAPDIENVFILECPLCFKHFPSPEVRSNHIKKCGKSKGLSTQSIIKALELQERHVLERISLGLPAKPLKPVKANKNPVVKKALVQPTSKAQSDIQLAKALSLSLSNSDKRDDVEFNESIPTLILKPPTANQRPGKKTRKGLSGTPLLVLRSDEDRKKLLLDKVTTILNLGSNSEIDTLSQKETAALSSSLKNATTEVCKLWHLSSKSSEKHNYYIAELLDWIKPSDVEMGAKLCNLSQLPGHEIVTQLPCDYTFSTPQEKGVSRIESPKVSPPDDPNSSSVISCLSSLVASSWMSDVDIHTDCGTVIPAHKLILAIRCPPLKVSSEFCSKAGRVTLKWERISSDSALQFLNFIYSGNIDITENMVSDLFYLANKYEVFDLLSVLNTNYKSATKTDLDVNEDDALNNEGETAHFESANSGIQTVEEQETFTIESSEDLNMDLDIICNCIDSSLKPSQSFASQSRTLNDTVPSKCFKCSQVSQLKDYDSEVSCRMEENDCELVPNSPVKISPSSTSYGNSTTSQLVAYSSKKLSDSSPSEDVCRISQSDANSPEKFSDGSERKDNNIVSHLAVSSPEKLSNRSPSKDTRSISPGIFDIYSDDDLSNSSDSEMEELPFSCSQRPASKLCILDGAEELKPHSSDSNDSEDSVKFLHSSYTSFDNKCNTPEKTENVLSLSPKFSKETNCSPAMNRSAQDLNISNYNSFEETLRFDESSNVVGNKCAEIEVQLHSRSVYLKDVDETAVMDVVKIKDSSGTALSKDFGDELTKNISPMKSRNKIYNPVTEEFHDECHLELLTSNHSPNESSTVSQFKPNKIMSPTRNAFSPEVLICDSGSDSDSGESISCETPPLHNDSWDFSHKKAKPGSHPANSLLPSSPSSNKANEPLFDPLEDPVYDSYDYLNYEVPSVDEEVNMYSPKSSKEKSPETDDSVFEPKIDNAETHLPITKKTSVASTKGIKTTNNVISSVASFKSPDTPKPKFKLSDSPITPLPDYKTMMTPEIKQALSKIGVRALPRKKAVAILSHIYNETHPLVDGEADVLSSSQADPKSSKTVKASKPRKRKQLPENSEKPAKKQQKEKNSPKKDLLISPESDESGSENPEWLGCVPEISFSQTNGDSPTKTTKDDIESIKQFIQSNDELHNDILNYKPLNLVEFHQELKNNGLKISIQKLMDFLDEQCITFTCPRKEEYKKKQAARTQRFRKKMIAKQSQLVS